MTMQELKECKEEWVYPKDICELWQTSEHGVRQQIKAGVFPVKHQRSGRVNKILRVAFINYMEDKQ